MPAALPATTPARFELIRYYPETDIVIDAELDLGAFYADNDLDPEDVNAIGALEVGAEHLIGGGAFALFGVLRVA